MKILNLKNLNKQLKNKSPEEILDWSLKLSNRRIVTTSFGTYSSILLSLITKKDKDIDVIWCDTGFNSTETYEFAQNLIHKLRLNINVYKPLLDKSVIDSTFGLPNINDEKYNQFKEIVKLEPFKRALIEHQPDIWFTNIRNGQTDFRNTKDILSYNKEGILKVSPFYYWSDKELDDYMNINVLQKNQNYFDVTKFFSHRECGIHFL